jgi:hypothetical protein
MSNSLELLEGSIDLIQKKYEILSDIVTEYILKFTIRNLIFFQNNLISLIVFEVPKGKKKK